MQVEEEEIAERFGKGILVRQGGNQEKFILNVKDEIGFLMEVLVYFVNIEQKIKEEVKVWLSSYLKIEGR